MPGDLTVWNCRIPSNVHEFPETAIFRLLPSASFAASWVVKVQNTVIKAEPGQDILLPIVILAIDPWLTIALSG